MSFYIPSDLQENPPQPTDSQVYVEERQGFEVVALKFGGFPSDLDFSSKAAMLYEKAKEKRRIIWECQIKAIRPLKVGNLAQTQE